MNFSSLFLFSTTNFTTQLLLPAPREVLLIQTTTSVNKVKQSKLPKPSTYKTASILIPEGINIRKLLAANPPHVKQCNNSIHQQEDKVAIILSLIVKAIHQSVRYDNTPNTFYAPVSSEILQDHVQDYTEYLGYLISNDIIETDDHYIPDTKCTGFRFSEKYRNRSLDEYILASYNDNPKKGGALFQKVLKNTQTENSTINKYREMFQDIQSVTVTDINKAKDYIYNDLYSHSREAVIKGFKEKRNGLYSKYKKNNDNANKILIEPYQKVKLDSWYESMHSLQNKHIYFTQDKKSFRLHTSVINIKSECRHFLRLYGKNIVSCDLKNSQPYLSAYFFTPGKINSDIDNILKHCLSDIKQIQPKKYKSIITRIRKFKKGNILPSTKLYINLVQSGKIYEFMAANVGLLQSIKRNKAISYGRNDGKNFIFKLFFNPINHAGFNNDIFRIKFPQVAALFEDINVLFIHTRLDKKRLKITDSGKNNLAILLQTIESHLILDVICRDMKDKYPEIPLITVHDSIATNPEYTDVLVEEMKTTLTAHIGIPPSIKEEDWSIPSSII